MRKIITDDKYIISLFDVLVKKTVKGEAFNRSDYYCGIANDVEIRVKNIMLSFKLCRE